MTFQSHEMMGRTTRRLRFALATSLLVHLLIFWPASLRVLTRDAPLQLQATLRMLPAPVTRPPPSTEQVPTKPVPAAVAPPLHSMTAIRSLSSVLDQSIHDSVPHAPATPVLLQPDPAALSAASPPAATSAVAPEHGIPLTEASTSGQSLDGLRGYRLDVATQARRFKRYPPQAMAAGWTGSVDIRLEVGADGRPRPATLERSSGHEPLDRAALAMIDAGALRARLSESLRGRAFAVVLAVVFSLDDD